MNQCAGLIIALLQKFCFLLVLAALWFVSATGRVWAADLCANTSVAKNEAGVSLPFAGDQEQDEARDWANENSECAFTGNEAGPGMYRLPALPPVQYVRLNHRFSPAPPLPVSGPPPKC